LQKKKGGRGRGRGGLGRGKKKQKGSDILVDPVGFGEKRGNNFGKLSQQGHRGKKKKRSGKKKTEE